MNIDRDLLTFAVDTARQAETVIMPRFRRCHIEHKADGSEVTEADREAEKLIRAAIESRFPDHSILGEEFGESNEGSDALWIIDPIDGTTSFTLGQPGFGVLIGLLIKGRPSLGVIHLPAMGETLFAATGLGCWHQVVGEDAVKVTTDDSVAGLAEAFVSSAGVHNSDITESASQHHNLSRVINCAGRFKFYGDCTQHVLVGRGRIHAAIDAIMKPWDTAAIVPCIREAGGIASTVEGDEEGVVFGGSLITCANRALHRELVHQLC